MSTSVTEGNAVTINVDLSSVPGGGLEVDLVVTLSAIPGTASECRQWKSFEYDHQLHKCI